MAEQSSSADEEVTDDPERGTSPASNATTSAPNGVDESEAADRACREDDDDAGPQDLSPEREDESKKVNQPAILKLKTGKSPLHRIKRLRKMYILK